MRRRVPFYEGTKLDVISLRAGNTLVKDFYKNGVLKNDHYLVNIKRCKAFISATPSPSTVEMNIHSLNNGNVFSYKAVIKMPTEAKVPLIFSRQFYL